MQYSQTVRHLKSIPLFFFLNSDCSCTSEFLQVNNKNSKTHNVCIFELKKLINMGWGLDASLFCLNSARQSYSQMKSEVPRTTPQLSSIHKCKKCWSLAFLSFSNLTFYCKNIATCEELTNLLLYVCEYFKQWVWLWASHFSSVKTAWVYRACCYAWAL